MALYSPESLHPLMSVMTPLFVSAVWNFCLETVSPLTCESASYKVPERHCNCLKELPYMNGQHGVKYRNELITSFSQEIK